MRHLALLVAECLFAVALCSSVALQALPSYDTINYNRGTFFGKAGNDSYLLHMAVDAQGYVYGTGFATSIATTTGAYQVNNAGSYDVMVFKLDPTMKTLIWATYIGGSNIEGGGGIAVNASGEVYVSGYTQSANFPVSVASDASYLATGTVNIFALKLSADGSTLLYSRILGRGPTITQQTATASKGAHIALNPAGEAFIFSHTASTTFQLSSGAYQSSISGSTDFTLSKLSASGSLLSSTFYGGTGSETSYDICYANGKVYCSGTTASSGIALRAGKTPDALGDCCVFVANDGTNVQPRKLYSFGSGGTDQGMSVWYDTRAHRVCLTGVAGATMAYTTTLSGATSGGFLAAADTGLSALNFLTIIGTTCVPTSITTRSSTSTMYTAGYVSGSLPLSSNAYQASLRGSMDGFMVAVDSVGSSLRYGSYIGGSGSDYSAAKVLIVDRSCLYRVVFGITTHSPDFPTTNNTYQPQKLNGVEDQPAIVMFSTQPTATLQTQTKPCNAEATFILNSNCPLSNVVWKFGDNTTAQNVTTVTHTYPSFGTYQVEIRGITSDGDTLVLVKDVSIGVTQPVEAGPDQIVCKKNPTTQLAATGAQTYRWVPGKSVSDSTIANPFVKPESTTTYVVYGKDAYGCESKDSVTIVVRDLKIAAVRDTAICEGRYALLQASGADFYSWTPTSGLSISNGALVQAAPKTTTTYTVIGYNGVCFDTAQIKVTVIPKPQVRMAAIPGVCSLTPVELDFEVVAPLADSDIVSIRWTPAQAMDNPTKRRPIVTPSKDGWYTVTVITKNGCIAVDSVQVKIQNKLTIAVSKDTSVCAGSVVQLRASGAGTYEWFPPDGLSDPKSASPLCTVSGTMQYRVIGHGGTCLDTQHVTVSIRRPPSPQRALGDTTICLGSRVHLWVDGGDSNGVRYDWYPQPEFENPNGASVYLSPRQSQTYTVILTNASGCTWRDSVRVHVDSNFVLTTGPNVEACIGENVVLRITSTHDSLTSVDWSPNDGVWDAKTGEYHLTVTRNASYHIHMQRGACSQDADMHVVAKELPVFSLSADTALCRGSSLQLFANTSQAGMQYRWMSKGSLDTTVDDARSDKPTIPSLQNDIDFTVLADLNGCTATKTLRVRVLEQPTVLPLRDTLICAGDAVALHVSGTHIGRLRWSPSNGLSSTTDSSVIATPDQSTVYTISVASTDNCTASTSLRVGVIPRPKLHVKVAELNNGKVFMPGDSTAIEVLAWSNSVRTMDLNFDVRWNASIFQPDMQNYNDLQDKRYYHVKLPATLLGTAPQKILDIHGQAMQTAPASSDIEVVNVDLDAQRCAVHTSTPSLMTIAACYTSGRNVEYRNPLSLELRPSPASREVDLGITSSERCAIHLSLVNSVGQVVRKWTQSHSSDYTTHSLQLEGCASGSYTLVVQCGSASSAVSFMKIDE